MDNWVGKDVYPRWGDFEKGDQRVLRRHQPHLHGFAREGAAICSVVRRSKFCATHIAALLTNFEDEGQKHGFYESCLLNFDFFYS